MAVKVNGKYISISINNEYTKLCEATKGVKATTIHKVVTIPTPEGVYNDGEILDVKEFAKVIKSSLDDNRMNSNDVVFSISSSKIATKDVIVPDIKSNKIDKIIETNAAEYFPVKIEDYIVQYYPIEKVKEDNTPKLKVVVVAAPANMIEQYYELAQAMGLKVAFIDYAGNSTYQIMKQQIGEEVSLVIQVENDGTVINIFKENVLQLQRMVPYGKSMLVNAVMDKYGLKYDAATTKLQNETLLHSRFDGDEVTESLRYMASNINRVIDYYVSRNRVSIQKAYLIGHSTTIKGFATLLSNELNMPITKVEALKGIVLDKKAYVEEATLTSYVTNLGAVVDPVDFVPRKMQEAGSKKENTKMIIVGFFGAVAVSALLIVIPLVQVVALNTQIMGLNKDVKKLSSINDLVNSYYALKDKYNDVSAFAALTADSDDTLQELVSFLEKNVPSDVAIQSFNASSGAISISGKATSKASVAKLIQQLESNSLITGVDVPSISESKDNVGSSEVTFSLSFSYYGINTSDTTSATKSSGSGSTSNKTTNK